MSNKYDDYIVSAIAMGGKVRVLAAITTKTCEEAVKLHGLTPLATAALGRTLTAGALMSQFMKNDTDVLTIQIKGNGPLGNIIVTCDKNAHVKGYIDNPDVDLPLRSDGKLDVAKGVGKGFLQVIKNTGLKEPYSGLVNLISGEIAEDLAYYFTFSEQVNSAVALGVLVEKDGSVSNAGGFIIQLLPGYYEECVSFLEERIKELPPVTKLLSEGLSCEDIIHRIFADKDVKILNKTNCQYKCGCSREKMERNLISLGADELTDLADSDEEIELVCHFCNSKYIFSKKELRDIISRIKG